MDDADGRPARALPLATKWAHGTGSMANGALLYMRSLILLFYSQVVGIDPWLVSVALGASMILDAFWDPAIGHFSDNLRTRLGRRHLLMFAAPLPTAILCVLLWNPPVGWGAGATFLWFAATVIGTNLVYSFFEVPAIALTPELAPGYHERTNLVAWRWVLGTFGALMTSVMGLGYFLAPEEGTVGQLVREGYGHLGIAVGVLILVTMLINAFGTRRYIGVLHVPEAREVSLGESLREAAGTLKNRNMGVAVLAGALAGIGFGIRTVLEAFVVTYIWGLPATSFLLLTVAGYLGAPFGALLCGYLSRRLGKKLACMWLFFIGTVLINLPLFLRLVGLFLPNDSPLLLPALVAFAGVAAVHYYGGFVLVSSMIADIVEETQARTGRRSEGLITAADQFVQKIITAMGTVLGGAILTLIAFPKQALPGQVPQSALDALGWSFLGLASILSFASIAVWRFYRIDQQAHEARLAALDVADIVAVDPLIPDEAKPGLAAAAVTHR